LNKIYHWKTLTVTSISIIILLGGFTYFRKREISYNTTAYEKELITYFKEIALQSEYDGNPERVIKWRAPMLLFVVKLKELKPQMAAIEKTIDKINRLATDGFRIVLTNNLLKSNAVLYLCKKEQVAELDRKFHEMLSDGIDYDISGLAYSEFVTQTHIIDKSLIFINSDEHLDIQESTILEEITQSLGLAYDSKMYSNSIFYKDKPNQDVRVNEYPELDRDIIRLLYHPKMEPGFDSIELERVIKEILKYETK